MSVAKVIEISSTSSDSFEAAIRDGIAKAGQSVRNIKSAWVKEQRVMVENNKPSQYQVNLQITFVLDDED